VRTTLAAHGLEPAPRLEDATAVCCTNDVVAIELIDRLAQCGRRVPQDVSVVGFDDIRMAGHARISLTTVRQPAVEMGRAAVEVLLTAISERRHVSQRIVMPTELVVRGSTAAVTAEAA
jgi:LacI family transcriptional regulator